MTCPNANCFEFGEFRLDTVKMRLFRRNEIVPLTPKAIEVLILLVQNRGETVSRESLLETVWKDTFIEEGNINFNVSVLRKSLGQTAENGVQYIKTIPKRGYRFVADVREVPSGAPSPATSTVPGSVGRGRLLVYAAAAIVLLVAGFGGWRWRSVGVSADSPQRINSIAVLPLIELGGNERDQIVRIALTDSLISRLGRLQRFAVRPLTAVNGFESSGQDAIAFARQMRVDAVLEGTVQQASGRFRVNVRLLRTADGSQVWSESFDEPEGDLFRLQDVLCDRVARSLVSNLTNADRVALSDRPTRNPKAYDYYVQGREQWSKRGSGVGKSIYFFEKAIELDPDFALAYVGLADAQAMGSDPKAAEVTLRRAIELNDGLAQTHATLGFIRLFHYFDWPAAEAELKTAIGLDANYATAHHWLGVYYTVRGRFDEARVSMLRAQDLDPTSPVIISDLAQLHYFSGDYAKALEYCESARALDPERAWNYGLMSEIMVALGRENEAFEALRQWHRRLSVDPLKRDFEATNPESRSVREFWQRQISKNLLALERDPRRADLCEPLVRYNLLLGNDAEAVKYVDCVFEKGNRFTTAFFGVDPLYDPIRTEPAFQAILKKMNL